MMKILFWISLLGLAALIACQRNKPDPDTSQVWTVGSGPQPAVFRSVQFAQSERSVLVGDEIVRFSKQRWGPAQIEGGSLQRIETAQGDARYAKVHYHFSPEQDPRLSLEHLEKLNQDRFTFIEKAKRLSPWLREVRILSDPELTLLPMGSKLRPAYAVDVLDLKRNVVQREWLSPGFAGLRRQIISNDFFDAEAWIFTLRDHGSPQDVLMTRLLEDKVLAAEGLQVTSNSGQNANAHNAPWKFDLVDPRFDQVQAFYFLRQGMDFFVHGLGFTLPLAVQVQTALGYPDQTNAAFTYGNQIRFGSGDGVTYGSLARDPSIVIHELSHVLIGVVAHLPSQGEGGSLNEAFADFFAASCLDNPRLGSVAYLAAPYTRNLTDVLTLNDRNGGLYHDSQIVSGTLWNIREILGAAKTQTLAMRLLARLGPATKLEEFLPALQNAMSGFLTDEEIDSLKPVLEKHAWLP